MRKLRTWTLVAAAVVGMTGLTGCFPHLTAISMGIYTPIPCPPWVTERMQEKYCYKNDYRTVIMPPIRDGFPPPLCEDPPDDAMILRTLEQVTRGVPYIYEEFRDNIEIVTERLVDRIDPPRFFPLIGPAQLHHCHWKCTVYFNETMESGYPFPFQCKKRRVEVVYIDKDHLHLYPGPNPQMQQSFSRDVSGQ